MAIFFDSFYLIVLCYFSNSVDRLLIHHNSMCGSSHWMAERRRAKEGRSKVKVKVNV